MAQLTNAQISDNYAWKNRVLLIFAPDASNEAFQQQLSILTQKPAEVTDRDLVFYNIFSNSGVQPNGKTLTASETLAFRQTYGIKIHEFICILVGKDGGEKLRKPTPISLDELFAIIDAMPMRKRERKKGD